MITSGKCWIYKRANLYMPDAQPVIIDYTDGTEEFDAQVDLSKEHPVYIWKLNDENIHIPLNIHRTKVDSIILTGSIPYGEGEIRWECLYGKFKPYSEYYLCKLFSCLPLIFAILLIMFLLR